MRTPGGLAVGLAAAAAVRVAVDRGNGPAWDGLVYDVAQAAVGGGRTGPAATTPATRR